jgi:DNA-binding transcriptional LysR family regulator
VPRAIERYRRKWPDARIDLRIDRTTSLIDKVVSGAVDIGVATPPVREIDGRVLRLCDVQDISTNELCAVLPVDHPLASRKVVRPADLRDEPLIGLPEGSATTRLVAATFQQARVLPQVVATVENAVGALALVQQKVGIGLVNPIALAGGGFPDVVARMFRPRIVLRTCVYRAKARAPSKSLDDFVGCLLASTTEQPAAAFRISQRRDIGRSQAGSSPPATPQPTFRSSARPTR